MMTHKNSINYIVDYDILLRIGIRMNCTEEWSPVHEHNNVALCVERQDDAILIILNLLSLLSLRAGSPARYT